MRITALVCAILFLLPQADGEAQPRIEVLRWLDKSSPILGVLQRSAANTTDLDRDGIPDIVSFSSSGMFTCNGINGLLWEFDAAAAGLVNPQFLGFLRLTGDSGPATHAAVIDEEALYVGLLNNKNPELTRFDAANTLGDHVFVTRMRASGAEVAIVAANGRIAVIGAVAGFRADGTARHTANAMRVADYALVEKFTSESDEQLGYHPELFPVAGEMDYNGDGNMDIVSVRSDANGIPLGLVVDDGESLDELWRWAFPAEYLERIMMGAHGFADVDGDAVKELFCGDNLVVFQDGTVQELRQNFRIRHLMDVDHDGLPDVIGQDLAAGRLVALGKTTATAVDNVPAAAAMHLHPAHPNPITSGSIISFSLDRTMPVRLDMHDVHGRRVRTLIHGSRDAGVHRFHFDGADAAGAPLPSGSYSIILTSATAQQRHGIIIVR